MLGQTSMRVVWFCGAKITPSSRPITPGPPKSPCWSPYHVVSTATVMSPSTGTPPRLHLVGALVLGGPRAPVPANKRAGRSLAGPRVHLYRPGQVPGPLTEKPDGDARRHIVGLRHLVEVGVDHHNPVRPVRDLFLLLPRVDVLAGDLQVRPVKERFTALSRVLDGVPLVQEGPVKGRTARDEEATFWATNLYGFRLGEWQAFTGEQAGEGQVRRRDVEDAPHAVCGDPVAYGLEALPDAGEDVVGALRLLLPFRPGDVEVLAKHGDAPGVDRGVW